MAFITPKQVTEMIERIFPNVCEDVEGRAFSLSQGRSAECSAVLSLVNQIPQHLLVMDSDRYIEFMSSIAALQDTIEVWRGWGDRPNTSWVISSIRGVRQLNPLTLIRDALSTCPEQFPSPNTQELMFITDPKLRENLRLDMSATNSALINGEWKAVTVIAGSVVEALLLSALLNVNPSDITAALTRRNLKVTSKLEEWVLYQTLRSLPS